MKQGKPNQITLDLTDRCQLKCTTCTKWKAASDALAQEELTTEEWKKVILNLYHWLGEGANIWFSGGEPFLRKDIFELASYAASLGLHVSSMTNAYSIGHLHEEIMDSSIEVLSISLNAVNDPKIHDWSRGREGAYEKTVESLLELTRLREEKGINKFVSIAAIILPENLEEIIPLAEYVKEHHISGISYQLLDDSAIFRSCREVKGIDTDHYILPQELRRKYHDMSQRGTEVINQLIELKKKGYVIYNSYEQLEAMRLQLKNPDELIARIRCDVASTSIGIDPYGDVRLCLSMHPIGNVRESNLEEFWENTKAWECRERTRTCNLCCRILNCNFERAKKNIFQKGIRKTVRLLKGYR